MKLIYADFMKNDHENRLVLTCLGTHRDLKKFNIKLKSGLRLVFFNDDENCDGDRDDLVVEGVVEYDDQNERCVATINWDAIKNISQLTLDERRKLDIY
ncbi:MAG: hypothetical protein KDB79_04955 [Acidobacteria bacterium]|nr:hypothetical protein [Acidobacteriota bacterium]